MQNITAVKVIHGQERHALEDSYIGTSPIFREDDEYSPLQVR
jgi:hypothetical protein